MNLKENDDTVLTCAVDYMGSLLFVQGWLSPGVTEGLTYNQRDEILVSKRTVEFVAEPDMDGKVFTCQIADDNNDVLQKCDMKISVKCRSKCCSFGFLIYFLIHEPTRN